MDGRDNHFWGNILQPIICVIVLLLIVGSINVFSSTFVMDHYESHNAYYHLFRHFGMMALGLIGMLIAYHVDYQRMRSAVPIGTIITVLFLLLVPFLGIETNGARRWLNFGFIFQPSELAKLFAIAIAASFLAKNIENGEHVYYLSRHYRFIISEPLGVALFMGGLVMLQPDLGTTMVIVGIPLVLIFLAGAPLKEVGLFLVVSFAVLAILVVLEPYRLNRFTSYYDPWSYSQTNGYQTVQSLIAIGSGGFLGQGMGDGISKFFYLPEAHTDFAFAVFGQEWGFLGVVALLLLFGILILYGFRAANYAPDTYGALLAAGLTLFLGGQGLFNIGMVCGLLPVTGVPMPFISYGGTSLIVNMFAAGVLMNIARQGWQRQLLIPKRKFRVASKISSGSRQKFVSR